MAANWNDFSPLLRIICYRNVCATAVVPRGQPVLAAKAETARLGSVISGALADCAFSRLASSLANQAAGPRWIATR